MPVSSHADWGYRYRRASLALAVGCIYRSKGGMSLQTGVANAVASLTAVSQACKGAVQLWILHGLCLTANAAGLAYVPYCKVGLCCVAQAFQDSLPHYLSMCLR